LEKKIEELENVKTVLSELIAAEQAYITSGKKDASAYESTSFGAYVNIPLIAPISASSLDSRLFITPPTCSDSLFIISLTAWLNVPVAGTPASVITDLVACFEADGAVNENAKYVVSVDCQKVQTRALNDPFKIKGASKQATKSVITEAGDTRNLTATSSTLTTGCQL